MKNLLAVLLFSIALSLTNAQDVVLLMGSHYNETDQSFGGKYIGFHNSNSQPYVVDGEGRITGRHLTFHENGKIETIGNFHAGIKNGLWVSYDQLGTKLSQAYYTNGKKDGAWKVWDPEGILRCEMYYKYGKRIKTWVFYDENGVPSNVVSYE